MKFNQLRLAGFKSFLEPTELLIKDGLTGIVGPNGCGKSNLVEALRWVMGETSAKNVRGGAMDDVIFAGTVSRPARNMAEVALSLDNKELDAPAAYNNFSEIDITRRIRRDAGSDYRINGKICRARDVQLLFADMATGAHSTAIVSQGRVGSLINAKPGDRRHLLEEAAGISGLHSRRREAELRLQSADANLERVDDVIDQLELQLTSLKRQSRQATRYSNLSGHIRTTEALLLFCKYEQACAIELAAKARLTDTNKAVKTLTEQVSTAQAAVLKTTDVLSPLRHEEAIAAAEVHKILLSLENLNAEEGRIKAAREQLKSRKSQTTSDLAREESLERDAALALENLEKEEKQLKVNQDRDAPRLKTQQNAIQVQQDILHLLQQDFDKKSADLATIETTSNSLAFQRTTLVHSLERLKIRLKEGSAETAKLKREQENSMLSTNTQDEISVLTTKIEASSVAIVEIEKSHTAAKFLEKTLRDQYQGAEKKVTSTQAEINILKSILKGNSHPEWPTVLVNLIVERGYEAALGAALGDELEASLSEDAPAHWRPVNALSDRSEFLENIPTLDKFVTGEPILQTRLSQVGVVSRERGSDMAKALHTGQRLVSKEGDLWRWDGYVRKAGALTPAALRLEQRNKVAVLHVSLNEEQHNAKKIGQKLTEASNNLVRINKRERAHRDTRRSDEKTLFQMQSDNEKKVRDNATKQVRLQTLENLTSTLREEIAGIESQLEEIAQQIQNLPNINNSQEQHNDLREMIELEQKRLQDAREEYEFTARESFGRHERQKGIEVEKLGWIQRLENMSGHKILLQTRLSSILSELESVEKKPQKITTDRSRLTEQVSHAKERQAAAHTNLTEAESVLADCNSALLLSQNSLSTCREQRVRYQSDAEHALDNLTNLTDQIFEKLACRPEHIKEAGGIPEDMEIPSLEMSQQKLNRLKKERDTMAPVNLRAHIEADEIEAKLHSLVHERADLEAAIHHLRQAIGSLNREGRERLSVAFEQVDTHFQALFGQVFGGGHAHLTLTESEDPLDVGLEIMASPPGKTLQLMSLLSGGEQALTAVALLFAVFLTNPAPICVLDEVDAPLDDVNVQRLCNLLDQIASTAQTRFLVVTHHPITMARMDRLYGVTMAERGISQLVSVDLSKAHQMTEDTV